MPLYSFNPLPCLDGEEKVDARAQRETWADMIRLQAEGIYPAAFASIKSPSPDRARSVRSSSWSLSFARVYSLISLTWSTAS